MNVYKIRKIKLELEKEVFKHFGHNHDIEVVIRKDCANRNYAIAVYIERIRIDIYQTRNTDIRRADTWRIEFAHIIRRKGPVGMMTSKIQIDKSWEHHALEDAVKHAISKVRLLPKISIPTSWPDSILSDYQ